MSRDLERLASLPDAGTQGASFSARIRPAPDVYLIIQTIGGEVAFFLGLPGPGTARINRQTVDGWDRERTIRLAPCAATEELLVTLIIFPGHVLLLLEQTPIGIFPLGAPASLLGAVLGVGGWTELCLQPNLLPPTACDAALSASPSRLHAAPHGRRRALVASAHPGCLVREALGAADDVVALAPLPWDMARLVVGFAAEIANGRLVPLPVTLGAGRVTRTVIALPCAETSRWQPADSDHPPGSEGYQSIEELPAGDLMATLGPLDLLCRDLPDPSTHAEDVLAPLAATARQVWMLAPLQAGPRLIMAGCQRFALLHRTPMGPPDRRPPVRVTVAGLQRVLGRLDARETQARLLLGQLG